MYAKLFASIYQGTLRGNTHGLVVFTNMLAHADAAGWVDMHPRAIAEEVGLTLDQVVDAISELEAPDVESRSPEEEGRRIVRLDEHRAWGWRIVNHAKYRSIRSEEDRREQNRLAQQRFRDKRNADCQGSKPRKPPSAQAEAEAEAEERREVSGAVPLAPLPLAAFLGDSNIKAIPARAMVSISKAWELPEQWGLDAEALGWNGASILKEAEKFRQYWTVGKGGGKRRTVKGWRQSWSNWLSKAGERA